MVEVWRPGGRSEERRPRHDRNRPRHQGHQQRTAEGAQPVAAVAGEAGEAGQRASGIAVDGATATMNSANRVPMRRPRPPPRRPKARRLARRATTRAVRRASVSKARAATTSAKSAQGRPQDKPPGKFGAVVTRAAATRAADVTRAVSAVKAAATAGRRTASGPPAPRRANATVRSIRIRRSPNWRRSRSNSPPAARTVSGCDCRQPEVRALARLEGCGTGTVVLRGSPKSARTSSGNGEAVAQG